MAHLRSAWLVGDPVDHSYSPLLHNRLYSHLGLQLFYLKMQAAKGTLPQVLAALQTVGAAGANLTIPHKTDILPYLRRQTLQAQAVGAVNCIRPLLQDGTFGWEGHNTDATGWQTSYLHKFGNQSVPERWIILGCGGAARAVVWALADLGVGRFVILGRDAAKASRLPRPTTLVQEWHSGSLDDFATHLALDAASLATVGVVNCTSVGMWPHLQESPVRWPQRSLQGLQVCDVIYNPLRTAFLQQAASQGADTLVGSGMLVAQALEAVSFFLGATTPLQQHYPWLLQILEQELGVS